MYGNFMLIKMQVDSGEIGELQVNVVDSNNVPIKDARVIIRRQIGRASCRERVSAVV